MTQPTEGPGAPPPHEPIQPSKPTKPLSPSDSKDAFLLNSPFAKMFRATGAQPTVKEIHAIINGVLKQMLTLMKQQDAQAKKSMQHLKRVIEGNE